jgi:hypothetical protein
MGEGPNLYEYVRDNPTGHKDLLGLKRDCDALHNQCWRDCWAKCPPWPCKKGDSCHYRYCEAKCQALYMGCMAENAAEETAKAAITWCQSHPVTCALGITAIIIATEGGAVVLAL